MVTTTNLHNPWSLSEKIVFRFFFIYVFLYIFPFPLQSYYFPFLGFIEKIGDIWDPFVNVVGKYLLGIEEITVKPNGSGDTTYNYVQVLVLLILSGIGTGIWSLADRQRRNYNKLYQWFRVALRYYLFTVMCIYGFVKVFKTQFPFPFMNALVTPLGEGSPMGLLWKFMGYSAAYNWFTGLGEIIGGFLLIFRRTTMLGACILIAVLSNVVILNFSYDVPVKLYSIHLLLFSGILLLPELKRILNFFVLNKEVQAVSFAALFSSPRYKRIGLIVKGLFIVYILAINIYQGFDRAAQWGDDRPKPPLYGLYESDTFVLNGDSLSNALDEAERWRYLMIEMEGRLTIKKMDGQTNYYGFKVDTTHMEARIHTYADTAKKYLFSIQKPDSTRLIMDGVMMEDTIHASFRIKPLGDFLLVNRSFNWVNEYPYNR